MNRENNIEAVQSATIPLPVAGKDMNSILKSLETGVENIFTGDKYAQYLQTMSKFHRYSFNNTLLIAMQRPDATLVTGYRNWQSMGRQVKKGEKGISHFITEHIAPFYERRWGGFLRDFKQNRII